jgi:protein-S-isoprenylcysteine O-methyltransferase Ste14
LLFAVVLFPLGGALVPVASAIAAPWGIPYAVAAAMYMPAFILARRQDRALQVAGTDRVNEARRTIEQVFLAALFGLIYVAVVVTISWGAGSIRSVGQGA